MSLKIWNFNMWNGGGHFSSKVPEIAVIVAEKDIINNRISDLFAFNEAHYENRGVTDQYQHALEFSCGEGDKFTPECFGFHWRNELDSDFSLIWSQYGELGILAHGGKFQLMGSFIKKEIAQAGFLGRGPPLLLLGARLKIIGTDFILPFYSTHIRGGDRRITACENMITEALDNMETGDLPPVIVGDFNFTYSEEPELWAIMAEYFNEMGYYFGIDRIEHFWVGKPSKFTEASHELVPVPNSLDEGSDLSAHEYINHLCPAIELNINEDITPEEIDAHNLLLLKSSRKKE